MFNQARRYHEAQRIHQKWSARLFALEERGPAGISRIVSPVDTRMNRPRRCLLRRSLSLSLSRLYREEKRKTSTFVELADFHPFVSLDSRKRLWRRDDVSLSVSRGNDKHRVILETLKTTKNGEKCQSNLNIGGKASRPRHLHFFFLFFFIDSRGWIMSSVDRWNIHRRPCFVYL